MSCGCFAASFHPQDGPHADLRVAIEDDLVRFSIGVNLAFLDTTIEIPRESLNELSDDESERLLEAFRDFLNNEATCLINGEPRSPAFERIEIFTHPDPGMMAIFPKMGARALIRATVVMRFDSPIQIETVELTWPAYPLDELAQEMEAESTAQPRMYFEAVLTANGKSEPARFTHAEPMLIWQRSAQAEHDPLVDLIAPNQIERHDRTSIVFVVGGGLVLSMIGFSLLQKKAIVFSRMLMCICVFSFVLLIHLVLIAPRMNQEAKPILEHADAVDVFRTLHESMYRAFDYTSESDIYDHLAFALHGDLLGELYEQIRLSLLQAEEEMKVGVVTGLLPLDTVITDVDEASDSTVGGGFEVEHRWRVDGTVYHWGHSHTRAHLYSARYRVAYTEDGWRLTEHELQSQQRIHPSDGTPMDEMDSIQDQLDSLGYPDI